MKPTIGILIVYYNEKKLLTECLDSIFSQAVMIDEVIVYDNCSEFQAKDYIPKKYKVEIIRGAENRGPGYGRNQLLNQSKSEYVHFHDADDLFLPDWYEKIQEAIIKTRADIVLTEITSSQNNKLLNNQQPCRQRRWRHLY